ncbi:MAG: glycosyltransferase [bacterium]|nr:glycosyltransferase [bacterium]
MKSNTPKVALLYDWLTTQHGGAEQVLLALHTAFPDAPLFTSVYNERSASWAIVFKVRTSFLQKIPYLRNHHRVLAPLMPLAFEDLDLSAYDLILSVSSAEAKGVVTKPHQLHICYLLTPPRYLYSHEAAYQEESSRNPLLSLISRPIFSYLKWWDQAAALRPDLYVPISKLIRQRCLKYYHRPTLPPIYPPVKVSGGTASPEAKKYYLVISRLVSYKRIDLAIKACAKLSRELVIVGTGPDEGRLRKLARGSKTTFKGAVSDHEISRLYRQAHAVLMPGIEDFGITAVEAVAHGVPAILHADSGAAELIEDGKQGIHLKQQTVKELVTAIEKIEESSFSPRQLQQKLQKYATTSFVQNMSQLVTTEWQNFQAERGE